MALLYSFHDSKIAHSAIAKYLLGFHICRTVVGGGRLLQARIFDDYSALFKPMFSGNCCIAASKDTSAKRHNCRERELRIGGKLFGIGN